MTARGTYMADAANDCVDRLNAMVGDMGLEPSSTEADQLRVAACITVLGLVAVQCGLCAGAMLMMVGATLPEAVDIIHADAEREAAAS